MDFDDVKVLIDIDYKSLLGIIKVNFWEFCDFVEGLIKNIFVRSLIIFVVIFFCKMKIGFLNVIFLILFWIFKFSLRRVIFVVRKVLLIKFVLENFGFIYILWEEIINKYIWLFV